MRLSDRQWLLLVIFLTIALCVPFLRAVYWLGDEGVLLDAALRMLNGERLYIDFFEFLPPGGFLATAAWLGVAGTSFVSARIMAIATITGIAAFTYLASRKASNSPSLSALLVIGWVAMSQGYWTQLNHNWFTTMLSMIACWAAIGRAMDRRSRLKLALVAGVAAGAAMMVTPHRGALAVLAAGVALVEAPPERYRLVAYALGIAVVPLLTLAFLAFTGALAPAFNEVVVYTLQSYAAVQGTSFGEFGNGQSYPLLRLFPLAAILMLLVCVCDWRACVAEQRFRGAVAFGFAGFAGCFPRPDIAHVAFAAPLAVPLLAHCVVRLTRSWYAIVRMAAAAAVTISCVPAIREFAVQAKAAWETPITPTSRGPVAFMRHQEQVPRVIAQLAALPPGDAYFFYPYVPMLPYLASRHDIARYDVFLPGYTRPSQYQETCNTVLGRAHWLVIDRTLADPGMLQRLFPAMRNPQPREKALFEHALESRFPLVARDGTFELRRRSPDGDTSACDGIAG